jgi:steroid 5-alpha reductase family enzyme
VAFLIDQIGIYLRNEKNRFMMKKRNKPASLLVITIVYVFALAVVYYLFPYLPSENSFLQVLYADIIATLVIFSFSVLLKNSSTYDAYWSVAPPIIAIHLYLSNPAGLHLRQLIVIALVLFWAVRLTANWARGWQGLHHQDWRYTNIANKTGAFYWPVSFLGIHLMPTIMVFLGCLPLWYSLTSPHELNIMDLVAILVTFVAVVVEWVSDEQLRNFAKKAEAGQHMEKGLWAWCRHPNYFGEISFWVGMYLFGLAASGKEAAWTGVGAVMMIMLFAFISIPMMDKRSLERRPNYANYMKQVPALWFRRPAKRIKQNSSS